MTQISFGRGKVSPESYKQVHRNVGRIYQEIQTNPIQAQDAKPKTTLYCIKFELLGHLYPNLRGLKEDLAAG